MILLPHFSRFLLIQSLLAWVVVRAAVTLATAAADPVRGAGVEAHPLRLPLPALILMLAALAGVLWAFARRFNLDVLLLALGYSRGRIALALVTPPLVIEVVIAVVVRL